MRVVQESHDSFLAGFAALLRWRFHESGRVSVYLEFGPGLSYATRPVPGGGTRLNYLFQAGPGATVRLAPHASLVTGLRWLHLSNSSLAGRNRNPDIQATGGYLGMMVGF